MNRTCLSIALLAGTAAVASAQGQMPDSLMKRAYEKAIQKGVIELGEHIPTGRTLQGVDANGNVVESELYMAYPVGYNAEGQGYAARNQAVYDALDNPVTRFAILDPVPMLDAASFAPGPWATAGTRSITSWTTLVWRNSLPGTVALPPVDVLVAFTDGSPNYLNPDMETGQTILESLLIRIPGANDNIITQFIIPYAATPGPGEQPQFDFPDADFGVFYAIFQAGTTFLVFNARAAAATAPNPNPAVQNPTGITGLGPTTTGWLLSGSGILGQNVDTTFNPGSSTRSWALDQDADGTFEGDATALTTLDNTNFNNDHRFTVLGSPAGSFHGNFTIFGVAPVAPPFVTQNLGCLTTDGTQSVSPGIRGAGQVQILQFCIEANEGVTDARRAFLDIFADPELSQATTMALYDGDGALVRAIPLSFGEPAVDGTDSDGDSRGALSFGAGIRAAAITGGRQFNGRDGQLQPGEYFLVIAGPLATFGDGFVFTADPGDAGGEHTIVFRNNNNDPVANPGPSVAPADNLANLGTIGPSGSTGVPRDQLPYDVIWYQFDTCEDVNDADFIDIVSNRSQNGVDTFLWLFDSNGVLVASQDDPSATAFFAQLSFGDSATPRPSGQVGAPDLAGQSGATLAQGTYFLAVTSSPANSLTPADRWHVRNGQGDGLDYVIDINTNIDCQPDGGGCPCPFDYNNSGSDIPDIDDLLQFFDDFNNGLDLADVNCTGAGSVPDVDDLLFFFDAFNGTGPCAP